MRQTSWAERAIAVFLLVSVSSALLVVVVHLERELNHLRDEVVDLERRVTECEWYDALGEERRDRQDAKIEAEILKQKKGEVK